MSFKKVKMNDIFGVNPFLFFGLIALIVSLIAIIYGINNGNTTKTLFNISRLLALLSVIGVWYFGNLMTKKTSLEIVKTQNEASKATKKTKEMEVEIITAKKDTENAKLKTEELKLQVEQANFKVEQAKNEREKLRQKTILLENRSLKLREKQLVINTLKLKVDIFLPSSISKIGTKGAMQEQMVSTRIPGRFMSIDNDKEYRFTKDSRITWTQTEKDRLKLSASYSPDIEYSLISKNISELANVKEFQVDTGNLIFSISNGNPSQYNLSDQNGFIRITIDVNGETYDSEIFEDNTNALFTNGIIVIPINDFCKKLVSSYLKKLGR